jgi:rubrerythrin
MNELNALKNPIEYQDKVLELMRSYELLLGALYLTYAEKFTEQADFWHKIAEEEKTHAYWIETLKNQIGNKSIYFNEKRFNIPPLKECISEVEARISDAKGGDLALIEAISISVGIENGMIERNFFEVFESDSVEIKKTFNMLRMATLEHEKSVRFLWDTERAKLEKTDTGFWQGLKKFFN